MIHKITITTGAKNLAAGILSIPGQFTTPPEILRAGHLIEILQVTNLKEVLADESKALEPVEVEITEAQRKLLQSSIEANAKQIPTGIHATSLLENLGFTE